MMRMNMTVTRKAFNIINNWRRLKIESYILYICVLCESPLRLKRRFKRKGRKGEDAKDAKYGCHQQKFLCAIGSRLYSAGALKGACEPFTYPAADEINADGIVAAFGDNHVSKAL
jgi:hypothetical protein